MDVDFRTVEVSRNILCLLLKLAFADVKVRVEVFGCKIAEGGRSPLVPGPE